MQFLQLLPKASQAILLLVFCFQLGTYDAQETDRQLMIMDLQMPAAVKSNEEMTLKLQVSTELRECMVIRTYLKGTRPMDTPFNFQYTACLCDDYPRTFFWDFSANQTMKIKAYVDVIRELGICPENKAVVPIEANRFYVEKVLKVVNY